MVYTKKCLLLYTFVFIYFHILQRSYVHNYSEDFTCPFSTRAEGPMFYLFTRLNSYSTYISIITFAFRIQCLILGSKYLTFTVPFKISFVKLNVFNSLIGWASSFPAHCLSITLLFCCLFTKLLLNKRFVFLIICSFPFSLCKS
jgi:hypothetical protein